MSSYHATLAAVMTLLATPAGLFAQASIEGDVLAQTLKPILIKSMPPVLYDRTDNWGHQAMIPVGLKWQGLKATIQRSPRNHGTWKKLIVTPQDLPRTLDLKIRDIKKIDTQRQSFKLFFTFRMGAEYEQQTWENGVRIWSGSVRARAQMKLDLECENTLRVEFDKDYLPTILVKLRATKANVHYDQLVVEHIAGIGGTGAKLLGQAIHDSLNQWKPSIERDLLAKANAAVLKAAGPREIRISMGSLLKT